MSQIQIKSYLRIVKVPDCPNSRKSSTTRREPKDPFVYPTKTNLLPAKTTLFREEKSTPFCRV